MWRVISSLTALAKLAAVRSIALAVILLSAGSIGFSQNIRGGINGVVTDQTGAVVSGCVVKATNVATGLAYNTTTTTAGEFSFNDLPLGDYNVAATQSGFSTVTVNGVHVVGGQTYNVPIKMKVASTSSAVEVSAAAVAL